MTDQQKIAAIIAAIQTDANVILLIRAMISVKLPTMDSTQIQNICTVLGIVTT